jgi:hypothetical protein
MRQETVDKIAKYADKLAGALQEGGLSQPALNILHTAERVLHLPGEEKALRELPLVQALWWYIENVSEDHLRASDFFFILRERYRNETQSRKVEPSELMTGDDWIHATNTAKAMGGHFMGHLARAYQHADGSNQPPIKAAYHSHFFRFLSDERQRELEAQAAEQ